MTISNLLTKTSALAIISHMAMTSAAFSFATTENDTLFREDSQSRPVSTQYVDFPVNIHDEIKLEMGDSNSTAHQFYDKKNDGFFYSSQRT